MDVREKLVELLEKLEKEGALVTLGNGYVANLMIANGVTVVDKFATTERQWISVKDRLPDETKDEYVLAVCDYHGKIKVETRKMWHIDSVVTHWMPLPQPPKGE